MLKEPISIVAISSLSALGSTPKSIWETYQSSNHLLQERVLNGKKVWVGELPHSEKEAIRKLRKSDSKYKDLDESVLFSIYTSRKVLKQTTWCSDVAERPSFGINIGSSRGATALFESFHDEFKNTGKVSTLTSPTTTLGNISSWVAHDLQTAGPVISHSITCSTALHALLNGVAWLQSGMADKFLVGGSEAPLTSFTVAQMQALKIYSKSKRTYPCSAMDVKKKRNTMVLGEGAAMACLERGVPRNALAKIIGIGYATELLEHNVSLSSDAKCFQDSMKMAMGDVSPQEIDAIVMHCPGTIKGDLSEIEAVHRIFGKQVPFMTTNKWKIGHTFGASGMLSIEMACLMLYHQMAIPVPFLNYSSVPKRFERILVNAVGFGGNAVSVLLSR
ncbi:beta-ketoacyl synthase N-terminal-like domain-containing protein [Flavobacteriaceae bacterium GF1]